MYRIGDAIGRELRRFGQAGAIPSIVEAWPAAVGEEVARNAWPARVARDGVLHVSTSSSAWAFELTQLASVVLRQLAAELDEPAPEGIRFAPGHLPEPAAAFLAAPPPPPLKPAPERVAEAAALASAISDDELREKVARAAALSLEAARDDRLI